MCFIASVYSFTERFSLTFLFIFLMHMLFALHLKGMNSQSQIIKMKHNRIINIFVLYYYMYAVRLSLKQTHSQTHIKRNSAWSCNHRQYRWWLFYTFFCVLIIIVARADMRNTVAVEKKEINLQASRDIYL